MSVASASAAVYSLIRMAREKQLQEPFEGALEFGETAFGGAHCGKRDCGAAGKVIVFGVIKRNGGESHADFRTQPC